MHKKLKVIAIENLEYTNKLNIIILILWLYFGENFMMLQAKLVSKIIKDFKTLTKLIWKSVYYDILLYKVIV